MKNSLGSSQRRIAWFLSLRSALHFSPPPLAPVSFSQRQAANKRYTLPLWARSQAALATNLAASQHGHGSRFAGVWARSKPAPELVKVAIIESMGSSATSATMPGKSNFLSALPPNGNFVDSKTGAPGAGATRQQQSALSSTKRYFKLLNEGKPMFKPQANGRLSSASPVAPPAGNSVLKRDGSQPVSKQAYVMPLPKLSPDEVRPANKQVWQSEMNACYQDQQFAAAKDTVAGINSNNIGGAATLHLDGAALGRWTIQHIERALSKPNNGMTGVDPRATMPRGHVSPF